MKCIMDQKGYAIYFSRGMIPNNKKGVVDPNHEYSLHLGLQCYDAKFLQIYPTLPATPLQLQEDLEQLKAGGIFLSLRGGYLLKGGIGVE